jgi:hypothetical protein
MKSVDDAMICELNILKNRLDSGESIIQCLGTMGIPLSGSQEFLKKWEKLSHLMMEGRILPAKGVATFVSLFEDRNRLLRLVAQKTLSPRIQAYMSIGIIFALILASKFFFPDSLKPSFAILFTAVGLSAISSICIHFILKNFLSKLCFLEWISFLRSIALSLECGMTFPAALVENLPHPTLPTSWPKNLREKITLDFLEHPRKIPATSNDKLWRLADRVWLSLCNNYREGLPQVEVIAKLTRLQEEEFKNWIISSSEKLGFLLLIPLFTLSVPAVLILLFGPLISALL